MMRQLRLLPAGCQPWNANMLDGTQTKFAYCSTLAVYFYELQPGSHEYKLTAINADHAKTITSISWNKKKPHLVATSGTDHKILVWDVSKQKVIAQLKNLKSVPCCIDWINSEEHACVTYESPSGYLEEWNISNGKVVMLKNISCTGSSQISIFRWHHTRREAIAFGHYDGSVSVYCRDKGSYKKKSIRFYKDTIEDDKVILLSWDPLSEDYILVANKLTGVRMVDSVSATVITTFCLPSRAVTTASFSWVNSAPGMFLTGDRETGVLRLWTVGQESPLENFKIKAMGFNGIHVLDPIGAQSFDGNSLYGSHRRKPSQSQAITHSVPPANIFCTFRDGGVGIYDLQRRKWVFLKDQGHIETIFDCKFKSDDQKMIATASFDGTIKVWSSIDLSPIKTSNGNEGVIYSISWAPQNLNCIAAGTRTKGVFVWNFNKGRIIKRFTEHGANCVFCVAWNQMDSHKIASGSGDGTCVVRRLDGEDMLRLKHPAAVYGCDWNNVNKTLLATGCEDCIVRIWSVDSSSELVSTLTGHSEKIFHVRWHPLIENILCSGSDDGTIRVWDTTNLTTCISVLKGHTNKVRGLSWNHEIPYLLVSGSWDSTIRIWDARQSEQKCLDVIKDHGADVYGLDSHSSTPFMMASTSRDSTLRLWSLAPKVEILFAKILVGHKVDNMICNPLQGMNPDSALKLCGRMSKRIADELRQRNNSALIRLRWFSELFVGNPALENLWDVAFFNQGASESSMSVGYKNGILHKDHLIKYKSSAAQELELSVMSKSFSGNRQQEMILEKAADLHLKVGNLRKYCDILKVLGRWESALSLAAGVSLKYWKDSTVEYSEMLENSGDSCYLPYRIAIGDTQKCVKDLLHSGELEDSLLIAQSACEGRIASPESKYKNKFPKSKSGDGDDSNNGQDSNRLQQEILRDKCFKNLALSKFTNGDPIGAATSFLAKNDIAGAIHVLVQGNESLLALALAAALKYNDDSVIEAAVLYSRKLEEHGNKFFAIELLRYFLRVEVSADTWTPIHSSLARYVGEETARENLHTYANLPSPSAFTESGEKYLESGEFLKAMRCFMLSTRGSKALKVGLDLLKKEICHADWYLDDEKFIQVAEIFNISWVHLNDSGRQYEKNQLLALSSFVGALKALKKGYLSVVVPLLQHTIAMLERVELANKPGENFPFSSNDIKKYLSAWEEYSNQTDLKAETAVNSIINRLFKLANIQSVSQNNTVVSGSVLPSHSDWLISSLTNRRISGPKYRLDDLITTISLNEAVMWARVNQFSPTGSGKRIVPF